MSDDKKAPAPVPGVGGARSLLDDVEILRALAPTVKSQLEAQLHPRALAPGDVLFSEGDPGDALYIIVDGLLSVYVTDPALGLTVDLATLGRGEAVGEMALVTGQVRSASVKAVEPSRVLGLSRDTFHKLVQHVPQVGLSIAGSLAKRLDQLNRNQGVAFANLAGRTPPDQLKQMVPVTVVHRQKMAPVGVENNVVTLATPNPQNRIGLDEFKRLLRGMDVRVVAVSESDYDVFVTKHYPESAAVRRTVPVAKDYGTMAKNVTFYGTAIKQGDDQKVIQQAQSQDAVDLLNRILVEGIDQGASDIHLEPAREAFRVRYRIDGRLHDRPQTLSLGAHAPILSRLKIVANLDIAERRLPQDGRISLSVADKHYDLRVSTIDTKDGEKATLRILDASTLENDLASLIPAEKVAAVVRRLAYRPNGLVLVTGPTGSGKTTTLYAALLERKNPELNICTIEDPIEYNIDGVTQVQVNDHIGLDFADIMRTFLRQDPDIILVGETRDSTTAKLCANAALTGHLVLSSFHTNDAISAVQRLRALDVEPFMIAESLLGVVNQRLVRRLCPACRAEADIGPMVRDNLSRKGVVLDAGVRFYRGAGCNACNQSGFKGRIGVYELLVVGPEVKQAIAQGADGATLREAAQDGSYVPLSRYASYLLTEGATVPSEVLRILA